MKKTKMFILVCFFLLLMTAFPIKSLPNLIKHETIEPNLIPISTIEGNNNELKHNIDFITEDSLAGVASEEKIRVSFLKSITIKNFRLNFIEVEDNIVIRHDILAGNGSVKMIVENQMETDLANELNIKPRDINRLLTGQNHDDVKLRSPVKASCSRNFSRCEVMIYRKFATFQFDEFKGDEFLQTNTAKVFSGYLLKVVNHK